MLTALRRLLSASCSGGRDGQPSTIETAGSGEPPADYSPAVLGEALVELLLTGQEWKHRRVDSVHLENGDQGRWRASLDCTIPTDLRLAYQGNSRFLVVPLALVDKQPMRDLDVSDSSGRSLPVLTKVDNGRLSVEILAFALRTDGIALSDHLLEALEAIAFGSKLEATARVEALLDGGEYLGKVVIPTGRLERISEVSRALLGDLARCFILAVVVPKELAGERQIIKFSWYWHLRERDIASWWGIVAGAFGLYSTVLEFPLRGAGDAASYHLEVHTPAELVSEGLLMPSVADPRPGEQDRLVTPVAHAHAAFLARADDSGDAPFAQLQLGVTRRGAKSIALLTSCFTFAFFLLGIVLPGGLAQLRGQNSIDGAADPSTLLLTLPAVVLGVLVSAREHSIASALLLPIRASSILCSALLVAAASSLTFQLQDPYLVPLWILSLAVAGLVLLALVLGELMRWIRSDVRGLD